MTLYWDSPQLSIVFQCLLAQECVLGPVVWTSTFTANINCRFLVNIWASSILPWPWMSISHCDAPTIFSWFMYTVCIDCMTDRWVWEGEWINHWSYLWLLVQMKMWLYITVPLNTFCPSNDCVDIELDQNWLWWRFYCLTATSHYLDQCWLITNGVPWYSS